jgi:hypothetical protein
MKMLNQIKKAILEGEIDSVQDLVKKSPGRRNGCFGSIE